jgi:hypothetical protein
MFDARERIRRGLRRKNGSVSLRWIAERRGDKGNGLICDTDLDITWYQVSSGRGGPMHTSVPVSPGAASCMLQAPDSRYLDENHIEEKTWNG